MRRVARALVALALVAGAICAEGVRPAHAYPQWQFAGGAVRCNQCHFSPAGGGLLTGYGRAAVGDDLSTFAGDGSFLHGAVDLPGWIALGGELRGAYLAKDVQDPNGATQAVFPMQADLQVRLSRGDFSVSATGGLRARVRDEREIVPFENYQPISTSRFVSREHYVAWQPAAQGPYARVGRFYAPYGLRLAEHITYIRRDLGFNMLRETYNASGGYLSDEWELHVTLFAPDVWRDIGSQEKGAAVYFEQRLWGERAAVGVQAKFADGDGMNRVMGGAVLKVPVERLRTLLLAEANLSLLELPSGVSRNQFVGAAGAAVTPVKGLVVTLLGERNQEDLAVRGAAWNAASLLVGFFPYAHVELAVMGRLDLPAGGQATKILLTQLHYFL